MMEDSQLDTPADIQLSTEQFFTDWAAYTVQRLRGALDKYRRPTWTDSLYNSLVTEVSQSGGNVDAVILKFLQYGRFIDMGVGRGVPIGAAGSGQFSAARNAKGQLKSYRRKPEHWYSKTYFAEVQKVKELYQEAFSNSIPVQIKEALTAQINISA
ncbi:hypothetical protein [Mucilaginibacter sp.]